MGSLDLKGHLLAVVCIAIWGSTFVVSKQLMAFMTPLQLMLFRFGIATVVLWILHPKWCFDWKEEKWFILIALFSNTIYFIAENTALTITNASDVSILVTSSPMITAVLLVVFAKDRLTRKQGFGFVIAFVGVVMVVLNGSLILDMSPLGYLLSIIAAASWSVYGLILRRFDGKFNSFLVSRKTMFYGLLTTLPIALWEGAPFQTDMIFQTGSILSILFLAVIASGLCYVVWNESVRRLSVMQTNLYINVLPVITLLVASVTINEPITFMAVLGFILVVLGLGLGNSSPQSETS